MNLKINFPLKIGNLNQFPSLKDRRKLRKRELNIFASLQRRIVTIARNKKKDSKLKKK